MKPTPSSNLSIRILAREKHVSEAEIAKKLAQAFASLQEGFGVPAEPVKKSNAVRQVNMIQRAQYAFAASGLGARYASMRRNRRMNSF